MGIQFGHWCMFAELGDPEDAWRLEHDFEYARSAAKTFNDRAERLITDCLREVPHR